jgi:predicted metal-dependent peptidase
MSIESINCIPLKEAIIGMQLDKELCYYGQFALYFSFVEEQMDFAASVLCSGQKLFFYYNSKKIEEYVLKHGNDFLKFLVIHEINHILLNHQLRTGERDHKLANIAQDMIINSSIKSEYKLSFNDFYYIPENYKDKIIFECLYDFLLEEDKKSGFCKEFVDKHNEMKENEQGFFETLIKEIHERLKAKGFIGSKIIEDLIYWKKEKSIVNIFKTIFNNGKIKTSTYKKLSRRCPLLKGKKKINKDINVILDTSGSLFDELGSYISNIIVSHNVFLVQCDTKVTFHKHIKSINDWKKVKKSGGGGTILQPSIDFLIDKKRSKIPTYFVSDFECEELDFKSSFKYVVFIKSEKDRDISIKNIKSFKVFSK